MTESPKRITGHTRGDLVSWLSDLLWLRDRRRARGRKLHPIHQRRLRQVHYALQAMDRRPFDAHWE